MIIIFLTAITCPDQSGRMIKMRATFDKNIKII